jgi:hypothetical protein
VNSLEIREDLIRALQLDLVGPEPGDVEETEELSYAPSRWYLTGFLVPTDADLSQRSDVGATEQVDAAPAAAGLDDDATPEPPSSRRVYFPSSLGLSVLVPPTAQCLQATVRWGEYALATPAAGEDRPRDEPAGGSRWRRAERRHAVVLSLADGRTTRVPIPGSGSSGDATAQDKRDALWLVTCVRPVTGMNRTNGAAGLPAGTRSVSVFLVNGRRPRPDDERDRGFIFQAGLTLRLEEGFVPRPDPRGSASKDPDDRIADLQYRDAFEYAVGHGVSSDAQVDAAGRCHEVRSTWMPSAEVERVEPAEVPGVELGMEALAAAGSSEELRRRLEALPARYSDWLEAQRAFRPAEPGRAETVDQLLTRAGCVRDRIEAGLAELETPDVLEAFRIANRVMAAAARRREAQQRGQEPAAVAAPRWRPFQLAFLLMNLRGIAEPLHGDRELVDLLFFPTGGGKTEAYLGLAAFTLVLRRLRNPGLASAGVAVLMRYTLRLLTLDQLGRAAALMCALELEREKDAAKLGTWPFEIGLWVGLAATPNRMGQKGDRNPESARALTIAFQNDDHKRSPIPLENCPWCGTKFKATSFTLVPREDTPTDLRIVCANRRCEFKGNRPLPIVAVDDSIYRRLPCFVIATVDKFAGLPWFGRTGVLFGKVDRQDKEGFYGPCDPVTGRLLGQQLLPPDLVIQDELHLISGPLGTMVGLYETAIDALSTRQVDEQRVRPKIVASTATVRRAAAQIQALFARPNVEVFPPPGPDRRDSFFARTVPASQKNARRYLGVAAPGRSPKVVLLRTYLALLAAAQKAYKFAGGDDNLENPADPYMTLLGYFGSLRELGGTRRIVEDEVRSRLEDYGRRLRVGQKRGPFSGREIDREPLELTSRESTAKVAEAKRRLALRFHEKEAADVALATNMISVGLDIVRLGLMVVFGQPKTTAEYIQATSRVGRDEARPGLVVTIFNIYRHRDRSHYERFEAYHNSFYRAVEATSVTPFSPRAVDRGLAAVAVALARLGCAALTPPRGAAEIARHRATLEFVPAIIGRRAEEHDGRPPDREAESLRQKLRARVLDLLDEWTRIADEKQKVGAGLQYQREEGSAPPLLFDPLDPALLQQPRGARKFRVQRSLRDVEPSVNVWARRLDGGEVPDPEEDEV